jgi:hypothetical protein
VRLLPLIPRVDNEEHTSDRAYFQVAGWQFGVETKNGWIVESGKERFENEI